MDIDADAPATTRAMIRFRGGAPGLFIGAEKLAQDARNFRAASAALRAAAATLSGPEEERVRNLGSALESLAAQWDMAAAGKEPRAP